MEPLWHRGGRGFESRPIHQFLQISLMKGFFTDKNVEKCRIVRGERICAVATILRAWSPVFPVAHQMIDQQVGQLHRQAVVFFSILV
jgi:hypothetical protein